MTKYKCVRACTWLGHYWSKGAIYEGNSIPPHHFENCDTVDNKAVNNNKAKSKPAVKPETKAEAADTGSDKS